MRYHIIFFCAILYLLPFGMTGQDTVLSKSVVINQSTSAFSIVKGAQGEHVLACSAHDAAGELYCGAYIKIDEELQVLDKDIIGNNEINCLSQLESNFVKVNDNYAMVSRSPDSITGQLNRQFSILSVLDANLTVSDTFQFNYSDPAIMYQYQLHATHDDMLLIGTSFTRRQSRHVLPTENAVLTKVNLSGELIWEKEIPVGNSYSLRIESIEVSESGDILIGMYENFDENNGVGKVLLLNPEGVLINEYVITDRIGSEILVKEELGTDNFYVIWSEYSSSDSNHVNYIRKFNRNGDILWTQTFTQPELSTLQIENIKNSQDGGIIGVGDASWNAIIRDFEQNYRGGPAWAFKLSGDGNLEWEKFYYDPRHTTNTRAELVIANHFNDLIETPDGDLIMVGVRNDTLNTDFFKYNAWMLKTDASGCLKGHYHCDTLQIVGDSIKRMLDVYTDIVYGWKAEEVKVYPNPASNHLTIEFPESLNGVVRIINMKGKTVLEQAVRNTSQHKVSLGQLPMGTYIIEVFDVARKVYSRKQVVIQ